MSEEFTASAPFSVSAGASAGEAMRDLGFPNKGVDAIVYIRDPEGSLKDLSFKPEVETVFEPAPANTPDGRDVIRHSATHVMVQAAQLEFPGTKLGIGPTIDNGFYYDSCVDKPSSPEDLKRIERCMKKIIKSGQRLERFAFESADEAQETLADKPYKLELIVEKSAGKVSEDDEANVDVGDAGTTLTGYHNVSPRTGETEWFDLCRDPHVPTTRYIPALKTMRSSAAYQWDDQSQDNLQCIYGTAWESKEALDEYLDCMLEVEKRDHHRLGSELDLSGFPSEIGSGFPVFHVEGGIIRNEIEQHSRRRRVEAGYDFVNTPHVTKGDLFKKSGHLGFYADGMFPPMQLDGEYDEHGNCAKAPQDYYVKLMSCPMHNLIFASHDRSYRELPVRMFEFDTVYRYEKSGVIHGLTRARGSTQDDAHIYCTEDQLEEELTNVLDSIISLLRDYGLDDFYLELSTKDEKKFVGSGEIWEKSTAIFRHVADTSGLELVPDPSGATFYGPKISVQAHDVIGRTWQMSTVQLDLNLPEHFELEYTAPDGTKEHPIMIHRVLFGSIERFFGVLLEHYAGAFPAWLAPEQAVGIPVADGCIPHLEDFATQLESRGIRVHMDTPDDRMQKKIRNHIQAKVPFMILAGARDVGAGAVSLWFLDGAQIDGVAVEKAVDIICDWAASRNNKQPNKENVSALQRSLTFSNSTALF